MKQQADDEIHEDQLLNFLVNTLTDAFSLTLGENAEISVSITDRYDVSNSSHGVGNDSSSRNARPFTLNGITRSQVFGMCISN